MKSKNQTKRRYDRFDSIGRLKCKNLKEGDFTKIIFCKCPLCEKIIVEPTYGYKGKVIYEYCKNSKTCINYVNERENSTQFLYA